MKDPEIRDALVSFLDIQHPDGLIVEEINICEGRSRVDVLLVSHRLEGFEIKSRVDKLGRLPGQLIDFSNVFERLTVVTGVNHLTGVLQEVPSWCGVMLATQSGGKVVVEPFRGARENPHRDRYSLATLLWRSEALKVLESRGLSRGVKSKPRKVIWNRLADSLSLDDLSTEVKKAFRSRPKRWRRDMRTGRL